MFSDSSDPSAPFGELLRRARQAAGLTQAELAGRAGLSWRGIADLERGVRRHPRRDTVTLLAAALGLCGEERAAFEAAARLRAAPPPSTDVARPPSAAQEEPGAPSLDDHPHNLPIPPTPLLGREREVRQVAALLRRSDVPLVTLTGPGGVGKTRLALQVAAELAHDFADGVWFVPLSRLADPALVLPTIARTLGLAEVGRQPIAELLRAHLRARRLLLVLDNCEQVAAAAPAVAELLQTSPQLRVLATSRVALHLQGEHEFPVPPLALPARSASSGGALPAEQLLEAPAVALFVERARAHRPDFALTAATAPVVTTICARLDGLPLALVLAAAWVKLLPPAQLLARLERRLPLLTGGARDLETRQQTMRDTLAWSEHLLSPEEQRLFRRLSVFVGGFTLEAAEAVCAAPTGAEPLGMSVLEGLERLVDHSLVQPWIVDGAGLDGARDEAEEGGAEQGGGETRFRLLYVVREYALERLEASGETQALRRAHAAYVLTLAEQADWQTLFGRQGAWWLARRAREHDNYRAALAWAREREELELGLRLGAALAGFWSFCGYMREGRAWLEELLALGGAPTSGRVEEVARRAGIGAARAWVWVMGWAGVFAMNQGEPGRAVALMEETVVAARAIGEIAGAVLTLVFLGGILLEAGDVVRGLALVEESLVQARQLEGDDVGYRLNVLVQAGDNLLLVPGEEDRAVALEHEGLELAQRIDQPYWEARARFVLGLIALRRGDLVQARAQAVTALQVMRDQGVMLRVPLLLDELAIVAGREGQGERAARLLGAAAGLRETSGATPEPALRAEVEAMAPGVRAALGEAVWAAAHAAGRALSLEDALAEALGEPR